MFLLLLLLNRNEPSLSMCQRTGGMAMLGKRVMGRVERRAGPKALKTGRLDVPA